MRDRLRVSTLTLGALVATLCSSPLQARDDYAEVGVTQSETANGRAVARATTVVATPSDVVRVTLDFSLRCPAGAGVLELFASIADTSRLEVVPASTSTVTWTLDVPHRQLVWLQPIERACANAAAQRPPDETDTGGIRWYRLQTGTQAYATLLCSDVAPERGTHSASTPVSLWLSCPKPAP